MCIKALSVNTLQDRMAKSHIFPIAIKKVITTFNNGVGDLQMHEKKTRKLKKKRVPTENGSKIEFLA